MVLLEKLRYEIKIVPVNRDEIHPLILKHYLKSWPVNIVKIYGIYHRNPAQKLLGMIIYGYPQPAAVTSLKNDQLENKQVLELKRLFIEDYPSLPNIESYVIARTLKMIKQELPEVKVVITFADSRAGHVGTIYQASNAIYLGKTTSGLHKYAYVLSGDIEAIKAKLQAQSYPKKN